MLKPNDGKGGRARQMLTTPTAPPGLAFEYLAASIATFISTSRGSLAPPSWHARTTTCEPGRPGRPDAWSQQLSASRCSVSQPSRSFSGAVRPTRISAPSAHMYVRYGSRGALLAGGPFGRLDAGGGRTGGESFTPKLDREAGARMRGRIELGDYLDQLPQRRLARRLARLRRRELGAIREGHQVGVKRRRIGKQLGLALRARASRRLVARLSTRAASARSPSGSTARGGAPPADGARCGAESGAEL
ncbi:hypothetical protein KFE25_000014 [Diacronema lutheri]|uniref:Uncharacterized protein n=1 Tax=Diacronema lutheri TaxID=2081491 RepID=A0A8J5XEU6_DIALT|nr:hypothetical protein KFE25_000014 [Diacronema lutheri]